MAETQHPTPWRLWDETMGVQVLDADGNLVCFVDDTSIAHQIAAAPDLLAACMVGLCKAHQLPFAQDPWYGGPPLDITEPCRYGSCEPFRAAIAKARGE